MRLEAWPVIGAWLGFKTVAKWRKWTEGRAEYNLFLIGNALVLFAAYTLVCFVKLKPLAAGLCGPLCDGLPG